LSQPMAAPLPFRPGGFGKPLWQLVDQYTRRANGVEVLCHRYRPASHGHVPHWARLFKRNECHSPRLKRLQRLEARRLAHHLLRRGRRRPGARDSAVRSLAGAV
jgi:hypothetical protein